MLRHNTNLGEENQHKIKLERKAVRRAIRQCVKRHKDRFRMRLAETGAGTVAKVVDQLKVQAAFNSLTKGYDLGRVDKRNVKTPIPPGVFAEHFKQLFSKTSNKRKLNLTEDKV
jgi:hypothetical protein